MSDPSEHFKVVASFFQIRRFMPMSFIVFLLLCMLLSIGYTPFNHYADLTDAVSTMQSLTNSPALPAGEVFGATHTTRSKTVVTAFLFEDENALAKRLLLVLLLVPVGLVVPAVVVGLLGKLHRKKNPTEAAETVMHEAGDVFATIVLVGLSLACGGLEFVKGLVALSGTVRVVGALVVAGTLCLYGADLWTRLRKDL